MNSNYSERELQLQEENKKLLEEIHLLKNNSDTNLHELSSKFNKIYNEVPVGILLYDNNLQVFEVNDVLTEMFQLKKEQIINFKISELSDKSILPALKQVLQGHEGFYEGEYKSTFSKLDLYISVHSKPFVIEHNGINIKGGIAVFEDITESTMAERAVNKSYDTFQRVTDNINQVIYVIDSETYKVLFMNKKAVNVFGDKVGQTCHEAFFKNSYLCKNCQIDFLKSHNIGLDKFFEKDYLDEFSNKWYQISYGFIEWVNGKKVLLLSSIDITIEKNALTKIQEQNLIYEETLQKLTAQNEQINQQSEQLKVSGAIKDTMFSIIAHDLRGPVGNITSALDIIIGDISQLNKKEIIEIIKPVRDSAGAAYNLLVNLLFWAKNESGETFFIRERILLNDIIDDVLTLFNPNIESKKLLFSNTIVNEHYVFADEHMIHTVIRNLVSNAVKYTNYQGKVSIGIDKISKYNKKYIKFWIEDNGVGISSENIKKILSTKEFFSTYGTNKEKGTGLGIILTKEFVEKHQGEIYIESKVGKGTLISILLPAEN